MKQKDKALSRLFSKNCPQKLGEGKVILLLTALAQGGM
jgi:hypothetical protein